MNPRLRPVLAIGGIAILGVIAWLLFFRGGEARTLTGYVEGERIYLAAPVSGAVAELYVREGDRVAAGGRTFLIDPGVQRAQADSAAAAVGAAEARAEDLRKGQRAEELSVYDAELQAALAVERQAEADYNRIEPLVRRGIYAPARLDQVRAARDAARAQAAAVRRRREVATLGARQDAIAQAEQQAAQAEGGLTEANTRLAQLAPAASAMVLPAMRNKFPPPEDFPGLPIRSMLETSMPMPTGEIVAGSPGRMCWISDSLTFNSARMEPGSGSRIIACRSRMTAPSFTTNSSPPQFSRLWA